MSEALSLDDFAAQLTQADQAEQPQEDSSPEAEDATQVEEVTPDQVSEEEAQAEPEQKEQPAEALSDDREIEWTTAAGETVKATLAELKAGNLRQQDYTQKTQALAEERKAVEAEAARRMQEVEAFAEELGQFKAVTDRLKAFENVNWAQLEADDPQAAMNLKFQRLELQQEAQRLGSAYQNRSVQRTAAMERQYQEAVAKSEATLMEKFPGVTATDTQRMFKALSDAGATADDIRQLRALPWAVVMAMNATKYLDLQAKKPEIENKAKAIPPKNKPAAKAAPPINPQDKKLHAAISGQRISQNDFAALLASTRK